jgi:hypothetical protein
MMSVSAPSMSVAASVQAGYAQGAGAAGFAAAAAKPSAGGCASCGSTGCPSCSGDNAKKVGAAAQTTASPEKPGPKGPGAELSEGEQKQVAELKKRDQEVRQHEQAHKAAGGQYAGSISHTYQKGPDGRSYAVGGEVPIDASPIAGDPQATIDKMRQVRAAALAPAEPSAQDRKVASIAQGREAEARAELSKVQEEEKQADAAEKGDKPDPNAPAEAADPNATPTAEAASQTNASSASNASQDGPGSRSEDGPLFAPSGVGNFSSETLTALMNANEDVGRWEAVSLSPTPDRMLEGVRAYQSAA